MAQAPPEVGFRRWLAAVLAAMSDTRMSLCCGEAMVGFDRPCVQGSGVAVKHFRLHVAVVIT